MKNKTPLTLLALFIVLILSGCTQAIQQEKNQETGLVVKVIDGDTIELASGARIRLIGINSTEKGQPCYLEAKKELEKLVQGKKVRLEKDKSEVDKYGRLLRYVYLNGIFVNKEMVKKGYAFAFPFEPDTKFKKEFEDAERFAKENNQGCLWKK